MTYSNNLGYHECHGDYRTELWMEDSSQALYKYQQQLPLLPVPTLEETCALYLKTVEPLAGSSASKQFYQTKRNVMEFLQPNGMGQKLQDRLLKRAKERKDSSWLAGM